MTMKHSIDVDLTFPGVHDDEFDGPRITWSLRRDGNVELSVHDNVVADAPVVDGNVRAAMEACVARLRADMDQTLQHALRGAELSYPALMASYQARR